MRSGPKTHTRLPAHLQGVRGRREEIRKIKLLLRKAGLHTVCESARCPNMAECFSRPTATFMILGHVCTRACRFCGVQKAMPLPLDEGEPFRLAEAAKKLGLRYVVVTSVTRDDLQDGGSVLFADTVLALRNSGIQGVELLVPDFKGRTESIDLVIRSSPDVFAHNIETVPRLYDLARPASNYRRSLQVIWYAKKHNPAVKIKSGMMLGLGETTDEVDQVMDDLLEAGCQILTIGQYLRPAKQCLPVQRYLDPEEFNDLENKAIEKGFQKVIAGPLVRSSYHADALAGEPAMPDSATEK